MNKLNLIETLHTPAEPKNRGTGQNQAKEATHFINAVLRGRMSTAGFKIDIRQRTEI